MGKNILQTWAKDPTHAVFGMDLEGKTFAMPISEGPHWIVAGQTGSGKSVFMNALLISMISHTTPDELNIAWVDPKKVEATAYIGLPYCPIDPVTDMGDAYGLMAYFTWLMDKRYEKLAAVNVKNVAEFNEWVEKHPEEAAQKGFEKMKYWVVVIDEYADMVMQEKDVEKNIVRLGQKARASAIALLIATQRPSSDIISPVLKANIPSRIALKVTDSINSLIILDETGAEKLAGYGDGFVKTQSGEITRVQGPRITNEEIDRIFSYLRAKYPAPAPVDYKKIVVDAELCEWAEEYADDVPSEQRHVKKKKMSRLGF